MHAWVSKCTLADLKVHTGLDDLGYYKCCAVCPRHHGYIKAGRERDYIHVHVQGAAVVSKYKIAIDCSVV